MKKILVGLVCCTILVIAYSFIGTHSVSASPAETGKGVGCYVKDANGDTYTDDNCSYHSTIRFDNDDVFQFFEYQDHGQLPDGAAFPKNTVRFQSEGCGTVSDPAFPFFKVVCGTIDETVTPSGEYKSSWRIH